NWTVPVALTPKFADPGPEAVDAAGAEPEDEQPAAAAATRAVAEKSARVLLFMSVAVVPSSRRRREGAARRPGPAVAVTAGAAPRRPRAWRYCERPGPRRLRPELMRGKRSVLAVWLSGDNSVRKPFAFSNYGSAAAAVNPQNLAARESAA